MNKKEITSVASMVLLSVTGGGVHIDQDDDFNSVNVVFDLRVMQTASAAETETPDVPSGEVIAWNEMVSDLLRSVAKNEDELYEMLDERGLNPAPSDPTYYYWPEKPVSPEFGVIDQDKYSLYSKYREELMNLFSYIDKYIAWNNNLEVLFQSVNELKEMSDELLNLIDADLYAKLGIALPEKPIEPEERPEYTSMGTDVIDHTKYNNYVFYEISLQEYYSSISAAKDKFQTIVASRSERISGDTGGIPIQEIGCYLNKSVCFVSLEADYGPMACAERDLYLDYQNSPNGSEVLSIIISSYVMDSMVNFYISEECYEGYPTFNYVTLMK